MVLRTNNTKAKAANSYNILSGYHKSDAVRGWYKIRFLCHLWAHSHPLMDRTNLEQLATLLYTNSIFRGPKYLLLYYSNQCSFDAIFITFFTADEILIVPSSVRSPLCLCLPLSYPPSSSHQCCLNVCRLICSIVAYHNFSTRCSRHAPEPSTSRDHNIIIIHKNNNLLRVAHTHICFIITIYHIIYHIPAYNTQSL